MSDRSFEDDVLEHLLKARERLTDPKAWIQHVFARNAEGQSVSGWDPSACKWCLQGAVYLRRNDVWYLYRLDVLHDVMAYIKSSLKGSDIPNFNDDPNTTHEDILRVLDSAIELARKRL